MPAFGTKINQAAMEHAQIIGMVECTHEKRTQFPKMNVGAATPQWDRWVIVAVMALSIIDHHSINCTPAETFHRLVPYKEPDLEFGDPLETLPIKTALKTFVVLSLSEKPKQNIPNNFAAFR